MRLLSMGFVFLACCSSVHRERGAISIAPVPRTTADHRQRAIPESKLNDTAPAEAFSSVLAAPKEPEAASRPAEWLRADSGACLQPVQAAYPAQPGETFVREALGLSDPAVVIALVIKPSFRPSRLLSLRRATRGRRLLRVTHLDPKAWTQVVARMQELQGPSVRLAEDEQLHTLADVAVRSSTVEHEVDRQTADLLAQVWHALLRRAQVVQSDVFTIDGTEYEFWAGGQAGTIVSPSDGSVLEHATRAAERLAQLAEARGLESESALTDIRQDLREALARTWRKEPCVRSISR